MPPAACRSPWIVSNVVESTRHIFAEGASLFAMTEPSFVLLVMVSSIVSHPCAANAPVLNGPYATKHTTIKVPGLQIGSDIVDVYYATNSSVKQRFIAFGHGAGGGQFIQPFVYKSILTSLASWGFVIGACRTCLEG